MGLWNGFKIFFVLLIDVLKVLGEFVKLLWKVVCKVVIEVESREYKFYVMFVRKVMLGLFFFFYSFNVDVYVLVFYFFEFVFIL